MSRFEYQESVTWLHDGMLKHILEAMDEEGWDLVFATYMGDGQVLCIFKRERKTG